MKNYLLLCCFFLFATACTSQENNEQAEQQNPHVAPTHNFTVNRLIVLNDKNEILMGKAAGNWYTLSNVHSNRQFVKESLDSLAHEYGITISSPKLHGYFSYKYEYHPYSTLRGFYVAKYISGEIKAAGEADEVKWMSIDEAIPLIPVESIKVGTKQILDYPDTLWGASFVIYRKGEHHHARMVEEFYPLFD